MNLSCSFFLCFLLCLPAFGQKKGDWKLKKEADDFKVYLRKSETSHINEVKVQYEVEASLHSIVAALKDVPAFPSWIYKCAEATVLEKVSDTETIYYCRFDFPFPMSDRDYIARSAVWQNKNTKEIFIVVKGDYDYLPIKNDIVRLPKLAINWHIQPISAQKVRLEYHLVSYPGGTIPDWVVNLAIDKGPVNSMKEFKEMLEKEKYKSAKLAFIQETDAAALRLLGK